MVSTRSQRKIALEAAVASTPLQDTRGIFSMDELIAFFELAQHEPELGRVVVHLQIAVKVTSADRHILDKLLAACLGLTPNVVILELFMSPPVSIPSLSGATLPRVEVLKTNIPHRSLLAFVVMHRSLQAIDLQGCGRTSRCALSLTDAPHITDIRCPADCASRLVHEAVERLRLDSPASTTLASTALSKIIIDFNMLCVLTVEFDAEDAALLATIADRIPTLRNLKLLEKRNPRVVRHKARPWGDRTGWALALQKLSHLELLVIRTGGALVSIFTRDHERKLFRQWVGVDHPHPTLRYIAVWQRAYDHSGGSLSEWSRELGTWRGKWTVSPDVGQLTMYD
ncbi:hypothetical protein C8Q76DRAFT_789375 [Earliella scabrosa]|nr:hypothetical protein C8Q76DRAFT_789375 [Earliella scabrosa]